MRRWLALILVLSWPVQAQSGEAPRIPLERLGAIISGTPDHEARFLEERRLKLLTQPIRLAGTLRFVAPDRVEKHTETPRREDLVVDGDWASVRLYDRKTDSRFRVAEDPVLQALVLALRAILNGQPERLARFYEIEATGNAEAWTLRLKPLSAALAERIRAVEVTGAANWMKRISLLETTGDSTVIDITVEAGG